MPGMRSQIREEILSGQARAQPHRQKGLPVQPMRKVISRQEQARKARENPLRAEAI